MTNTPVSGQEEDVFFVNRIRLPDTFVHLHSGKVRETFENPDNPEQLIMIATDRISTHDVVHKNEVSGKGEVLTDISNFWFREFKKHEETKDIKTHIVENPIWPSGFPDELKGRSIIVQKITPLPIEAVVRGYLYGSALSGYNPDTGMLATGEFIGIGCKKCSKFQSPLFTPSTKSDFGDKNIDFNKMVEHLKIWLDENGYEDLDADKLTRQIRVYSIKIYELANKVASEKGIIIGDTKLEFGLDKNNNLIVIDEVITPDSSRFWRKLGFEVGKEPISFDKEYVREWIVSYWKKNPDKNGKKYGEEGFEKYPVLLPEKVLDECEKRYSIIKSRFIGDTLLGVEQHVTKRVEKLL